MTNAPPKIPPTLAYSERDDELRHRIRSWIESNDMGPLPSEYHPRLQALAEWQSALDEAGFMALSWPTEYGGGGYTLTAEAVLGEELARSSRPELVNRLAMYTWGPTILDFGTEEQKAAFLPGMLDASEIWCQGFSEPEAGSDLASVRTSATVEEDSLVINGQKVWTTRAELSKWNAMLVRTGQGESAHRGLSVVIVDMESPGITIRPLPQMLNEPHFSEVFFDDVVIPIENVLGTLDGGWRVAMEAMSYERGLFVLERQIKLQMRLGDLVERLARSDSEQTDHAAIGSVKADLDLLQGQVYRTLAGQLEGDLPPGSTSVDKLHLANVYQHLFTTAYDILGDKVATGDTGDWMHDLLESRSVSIYSGTSEIQKNIIADRMLGLR